MGEVIAIIAVSGVVACAILSVLGGLIIGFVKATRGGAKVTQADSEEETRMIQEMYHGLNKMADRVEALETLLIDSDRSREEKFERELEKE